jgi:CheY-like chemotaxis protein
MTHAGSMPVRCIIVDDNLAFLRTVRDLLEGEGIRVVGTVSTGAQAYRVCRDLRPDVALIDIDLGAETGFEVVRRLGGLGRLEQPRMILISAYAAEDFEDMLADTPAASFLSKAGLSGAAIRGILAGPGGPGGASA